MDAVRSIPTAPARRRDLVASPSLAPFFTVDIPDDAELLGRVLEILHESSVVEAAYVKPADEPP